MPEPATTESQISIQSNIATIAASSISLYTGTAEETMREIAELDIDCMELRTYADSLRRENAIALKAIEEKRMSFTRPIRALERATNELFNPAIAAMEQINTALRTKILAFDTAAEEARRLREAAARAVADAERKRLEDEQRAEAEQQRQLAEDKRRAAQAAAMAGNGDHAQALINEAKNAEATAAAVEATPVYVPVAIVPSEEKPKGSSYGRDNWKVRILDEKKVPREYCMPNLKDLESLGKRTKGQAKVEGVEFWNDKGLVGR